MRKKIWILSVFICILLLAGCSQAIKDPLNLKISNFSAVNQNGETVNLNDLKGKVWIADFIYTTCTTACPPMTQHFAILQKKLKDEGLNVQLVSFSIDPKVDTPKVLTAFAKNYRADFKNWSFLTGYSQKFIEDFAYNDFKTVVKKPDSGSVIAHGTFFYLIDKNGEIMKNYSGLYDVPYADIIHDARILTKD